MPAVFLKDRSLIAVGGAEAQSFLQNLITTDIASLGENEARPGALLTPQGKILFDFLIWRDGDGFVIETDAGQRDALIKRLTMYKLRAAVDLAVVEGDTVTVAWDAPAADAPRDARFAKAGLDVSRRPGDGGADDAALYDTLRISAGIPEAGMDALIVTGAEQHADRLSDEPYWPALIRLMDWAAAGTVTTLFSGQAAHGAVQHFDGIRRRPLPKKLSGVFASLRAAEDPLLAGVPARATTPHSRKHGVSESDLTSRGYRVLARLMDGSVDLFVREGRSRLVFVQGHPEYGADALGREYLSDMALFLEGQGERPQVPENYFDRVTENALLALAGHPAQIADYMEVVTGAVPLQSWRGTTLRLFANWIASIAAEKPRRRIARTAATHRSA